MYEVIEIERIVLERVEHLDQIRVEFRWKIKGLSLAQQLVNDLGMEIRTKNPPGAKVQQSEERQKLIGAELKHSVIMQKSKYGYFLPLRGEPHWTAPLGDTAEASAKQSIDERG